MSFPIFPWNNPFPNFGFNFFNVDNTPFCLGCIHLRSFERLNASFGHSEARFRVSNGGFRLKNAEVETTKLRLESESDELSFWSSNF